MSKNDIWFATVFCYFIDLSVFDEDYFMFRIWWHELAITGNIHDILNVYFWCRDSLQIFSFDFRPPFDKDKNKRCSDAIRYLIMKNAWFNFPHRQ